MITRTGSSRGSSKLSSKATDSAQWILRSPPAAWSSSFALHHRKFTGSPFGAIATYAWRLDLGIVRRGCQASAGNSHFIIMRSTLDARAIVIRLAIAAHTTNSSVIASVRIEFDALGSMISGSAVFTLMNYDVDSCIPRSFG